MPFVSIHRTTRKRRDRHACIGRDPVWNGFDAARRLGYDMEKSGEPLRYPEFSNIADKMRKRDDGYSKEDAKREAREYVSDLKRDAENFSPDYSKEFAEKSEDAKRLSEISVALAMAADSKFAAVEKELGIEYFQKDTGIVRPSGERVPEWYARVTVPGADLSEILGTNHEVADKARD